MAGTRTFVAGNFALQLDGVQCGFLKSVDGGDISAEVVDEAVGPAGFVKKHIGQPKYEDFVLKAGFELTKPFYDWIAAAWNLKIARKSGAIISTDANFKAVSERQFVDALIAETTIPALDASSKEPAYLTVHLSPELTRSAKATGTIKATAAKKKTFIASNFRVEIGGLDCKKVSKVDSFTVKQNVTRDEIGDRREPRKEPGTLEFPNLKVTFAAASAKTWEDWFEDFVVKGNSGEKNEKSGALVFLGPDLKAELGRVTLHNVGIFALRHPAPAGKETIQKVVAELYCERMELQVGAAAKPA